MENPQACPPPHHEQKEPPAGATFLRSVFNGLNVLSGVGLLSIPYALSQGGWFGLGILVLMAVVCYYTGILLHRCMLMHPNIKSYPDIGKLAFGNWGGMMVSFLMHLEVYLVAVGFLILEGDNLAKIFPHVTFHIGSLKFGGSKCFILIATAVILPTTWLRSLSVFAYVSACGVFASVLVSASVIWVGAVDGVGFHEHGAMFHLSGFPSSISLITFCYCGHAVFPTLCSSMRDKNQFPKVLIICFLACTLSYGLMAVVGYMMYGDALTSQITLNLPLEKVSAKIAIYTMVITPVTKYALMISPIMSAIENRYPVVRNNVLINILSRTAIVISTLIVALAVPFFGYLMAFIGAFLGVLGCMLIPCICYLKISHIVPSFSFEFVVILMILGLGLLVGILGTYTSIKQIVDHL